MPAGSRTHMPIACLIAAPLLSVQCMSTGPVTAASVDVGGWESLLPQPTTTDATTASDERTDNR